MMRNCALLVGERCMDWPAPNQLSIDKDCEHGQVRRINYDWVDSVVAKFTADPPKQLEIIVWHEQGVPRA